MSVVRVKIQKDFTVLYNGVLENPRLSFKAKGLWAYCMSRPDNWQFHVNHLGTVSKEGVDAVYSALKELEAEGLVEKTQKNQNGKFGKIDYVIYPYPDKLKKCLPQTENPEAVEDISTHREENSQVVDNVPLRDFPQTENPPLTNTDSLTSKEKREREAPPPTPPPFQNHGVIMPLEKYDSLVREFGPSKINEMVDRLEEYSKINPKRFKQYACHATVIRKWIREDKNSPSKDLGKENERLSKVLCSTFPRKGIDLVPEGLGFDKGVTGGLFVVKFADKAFRAIVDSECRKRGIDWSKIECS